MNKRICDICDKREASNNFRTQQEKEVTSYSTFGFPIPKMEWVELHQWILILKKLNALQFWFDE